MRENLIFTHLLIRILSLEQEVSVNVCVHMNIHELVLLSNYCHHPLVRFYSPESQRVRSAIVDELLNLPRIVI